MPKLPREIVQKAFDYLANITPPTQKISEVRVEELQPFQPFTKERDNFWKVVLSFDNVGHYPFDKKREYKEFKVSEEGNVIYMKSVDGK